MTKKEKAVELFNQGFNCTQSVLCAFAYDLGLSQAYGLKIAAGFGA